MSQTVALYVISIVGRPEGAWGIPAASARWPAATRTDENINR